MLLTRNMFFTALLVASSLILNLTLVLIIITTVLVGGVLPLIERKFLSLIQRRVGPNIVGHKGRLQFIADALKLFLKEVIFLRTTNVSRAVLLPLTYLLLNLGVMGFLV